MKDAENMNGANSPTPKWSPPASTRGFWALFITQFQGAFSDNLFRILVMFLIVNMTLPFGDDMSRELRMVIVGALFALPFILFSMAGGYLADRFSKRSVSIGTKFAEILIMTVATWGLLRDEPVLLLLTVFLMGAQSAFFGPSKYGLLPELLPEKKLSWGNGVIELGTFLAIITGTICGGILFFEFRGQQVWAGAVLIGLAILGTVTSFGISRVPAAATGKNFRVNFVGELLAQVRNIRRDRVLALAVLGNTYFFFQAALIQQYTIYPYGKDLLGLDEDQVTTYLMAAMAVGIGVGSFAAGHLSGKKIEYGLVPLGSLGMVLFGLYLALPDRSLIAVVAGLASFGFFAGFFIVPIAALIQQRPDRSNRGEVIAASNFLSFVGIFLAAGVFYVLSGILELGPRQVFLVATALTFLGTIYALRLMPSAFLRFVLWFVTNTLYRIRVEGRDNIPEKGGALFVCNHVSFVDALLLIASTDRHVRFMMYKGTYELPYVKPFARILGIIPISSEQRPRDMLKSLQTASQAIRDGQVVCIFAEGQITRIGQLLPFRRGMERIMKDVNAPIVPVALSGVWGSIFSFEKRRFIWKLPRKIPYPVTVSFGAPMPATATAVEVRQAVQELQANAWEHRREDMKPLQRAFVRTARRHPRRFAMADLQTPNVKFGAALVRTVFLARRLKKVWRDQKLVGLLLPPSVPGALVNYAALLCGKVPVNLNYTVSAQTLASCIEQCELKTVLTSRAFLEKIKLSIACETIFLEDVVASQPSPAQNSSSASPAGGDRGEGASVPAGTSGTRWNSPSCGEKLVAFLMAWLLPVRLLEKSLGNTGRTSLDSLATVIFSSGSTGEPKGVMLTHYNVVSNIEQMEQVFGLDKRDRVLGVLPFFHSFGFTGTLCLPATLGVGVVFHPNPLDAKLIGPLVAEYAVTFLLATPTFLQLYMRGCEPSDFGSLRVVMTGAEKLPERLALAFDEHFGIRPLEGYGCTECGPAVSVNAPDFRSAGFRQVGGKRGKIGHPLPGVSVRIVDPENPRGPSLPVGQAGLLLVRGPNVMRGYLGKPEKTAEVLVDAPHPVPLPIGSGEGDRRPGGGKWYVTGDIAALDEDGFLQITDRLSRFSKIGGEMVPHIKVEEKLHELAGVTEQTFVVTSAPDEKKGERLVVLHKLPEEKLQACIEKLNQSELPNLWKPKPDAFFGVENFPMLGTGKLDLRKIRELAGQLSAPASAELASQRA